MSQFVYKDLDKLTGKITQEAKMLPTTVRKAPGSTEDANRLRQHGEQKTSKRLIPQMILESTSLSGT